MLEWLGGSLVKGALDKVFDFVVKVYELFRGYFVASAEEQKRKVDEKIAQEKFDKGSRPDYGDK